MGLWLANFIHIHCSLHHHIGVVWWLWWNQHGWVSSGVGIMSGADIMPLIIVFLCWNWPIGVYCVQLLYCRLGGICHGGIGMLALAPLCRYGKWWGAIGLGDRAVMFFHSQWPKLSFCHGCLPASCIHRKTSGYWVFYSTFCTECYFNVFTSCTH